MVRCRACGSSTLAPFIDLGSAPLSNGYLTEEGLHAPEAWLPLKVNVCTRCWLAQTEDYLPSSEIFTHDYAYFSSASRSWLMHAENFVKDAVERFQLNASNMVIEIASNDGYLLQYVQERGIQSLGIEPTASTAAVARSLGLEIVEEFLQADSGAAIAERHGKADLVIANNVLAHVPDVNDFLKGVTHLLKEDGVFIAEFPRLTSLVDGGQFDTIYHEHYSYLSLHSVAKMFANHGIEVFDALEVETHGGSLRVFGQLSIGGKNAIQASVERILDFERKRGLTDLAYYQTLQERAVQSKSEFLGFLLKCKEQGKLVVGYGAAAKGNTLLNFAGVRPDLLPFVVDKSESKVGRYLPGSRIPILHEDEIKRTRPDYLLILPWNITREVTEQLAYVREWGAVFVTAIPQIHFS